MHKTCINCGASNAEHARFCGKCGTSLHDSKPTGYGANERTPADQAAEIVERTKIKTDELKMKTKNIWENFAVSEKIIAAGAIAVLLSFFLPQVLVPGKSISGLDVSFSDGWYFYLTLFSSFVSLALLYFSQGATPEKRVLAVRWQILIGTVWATAASLFILTLNAILSAIQKAMGGFGALFGASSNIGVSIGIGLYLTVIGSIAIVVGAFKLQKELLK